MLSYCTEYYIISQPVTRLCKNGDLLQSSYSGIWVLGEGIIGDGEKLYPENVSVLEVSFFIGFHDRVFFSPTAACWAAVLIQSKSSLLD